MSTPSIALPRHGGQLRAIARQFNLKEQELIDFSASIGSYPLPEQVHERLRSCAGDPGFLAAYPDLENQDLKEAISTYAAVPEDAIAVGNGIIPILDATLRALEIRRCLVVEPCFSGYARSLGAARVEAVPFALDPAESFALSGERLLRSIRERRCDAVILANPHNPSGALTPASELEELSQQAASADMTVLLDEAFIDFEPASSLCSGAPNFKNTVVFRSLTKVFPIPALRVAYAVASAPVAGSISGLIPEWPISSLASVAAIELMGSRDYQSLIRESNVALRDALVASMQEIGLKVFPSRANYLLVQMKDEETGLAAWRSLIADYGIVARCCQNFAGLDTGYLRFTVRKKDENDALVRALKEVVLSAALV